MKLCERVSEWNVAYCKSNVCILHPLFRSAQFPSCKFNHLFAYMPLSLVIVLVVLRFCSMPHTMEKPSLNPVDGDNELDLCVCQKMTTQYP